MISPEIPHLIRAYFLKNLHNLFVDYCGFSLSILQRNPCRAEIIACSLSPCWGGGPCRNPMIGPLIKLPAPGIIWATCQKSSQYLLLRPKLSPLANSRSIFIWAYYWKSSTNFTKLLLWQWRWWCSRRCSQWCWWANGRCRSLGRLLVLDLSKCPLINISMHVMSTVVAVVVVVLVSTL